MSDDAGLHVARWVLLAAMVFTGLAIWEEQRYKHIESNHKTLESVVILVTGNVAELHAKTEAIDDRVKRLEDAGQLVCE